jgi:hypothetical protein
MIQLLNILKNNVSDRLLFEEQSDMSSDVNQYLTNYFSDLIKLQDFDGYIFATGDGKDIVFFQYSNEILMNRDFYNYLPDFVKFGIEDLVSKKLSAKFMVNNIDNDNITPILKYLKYKSPITWFLNLKLLNLEVFEYENEQYFLDVEDKKIITHLFYRQVFIDEDILNSLTTVFNINLSSIPQLAIRNWFYDFYNNKGGFEIVSTGRLSSYFYYKIKDEGKYLGLVKDNLKND